MWLIDWLKELFNCPANLQDCEDALDAADQEIGGLKDALGSCQAEVANLRDQLPLPPPALLGLGEIGVSSDIVDLIVDAWGYEVIDQGKIKPGAGSYKVTTIGNILDFLNWAKINELPYTPGYHTCVDFGYGALGAFMNQPGWWAVAVGAITIATPAGWHVILAAFAYPSEEDKTLTLYFIETQSNRLLNPTLTIQSGCKALKIWNWPNPTKADTLDLMIMA